MCPLTGRVDDQSIGVDRLRLGKPRLEGGLARLGQHFIDLRRHANHGLVSHGNVVVMEQETSERIDDGFLLGPESAGKTVDGDDRLKAHLCISVAKCRDHGVEKLGPSMHTGEPDEPASQGGIGVLRQQTSAGRNRCARRQHASSD